MEQQKKVELYKHTAELLSLNKEAELYYLTVAREEGIEPDFYGKVKPFADKVKEVRDKWVPLALDFVQTEKPLHLHPSQITQTEENLEIVAIKSFFPKTGKKRQIETFKSVEYVLQQLANQVKEKSC